MPTNTLQQLVTIAKADGGKFFVIDETGQPVLVIMGIDDYEQVLMRKVQSQAADIEEANRLIMDAARRERAHRQEVHQAEQDQLKAEVMGEPVGDTAAAIDPSFGFDPRGAQGDY